MQKDFRKSGYLRNAAMLSASGFLLRAAAMLFEVYLASRIGAEGMGLYQLINTVYGFAVTLGTAGISVLSTRIVASLSAKQETAAIPSAVRRTVLLSLALGGIGGLLLFIGAGGGFLPLPDERMLLPLRILSPSLPFMAVTYVFKGYFIALRKVRINAKAQLYEQLIKIAVTVLLLVMHPPAKTEAALIDVMIGITAGEIYSFLLFLIYYRKEPPPQGVFSPPPPLHELLAILLPLSATQFIASALGTAENIFIPRGLTVYCGSREEALAQYGALKGMALPILLFPFSFLGPMQNLLIPEIIEAHASGRRERLQQIIRKSVSLLMSGSGLAVLLYLICGREICLLFFHREDAARYLLCLAPLVPFFYLDTLADSILKGLDEQRSAFFCALTDSIMRVTLIFLLVPRIGMQGMLWMMLASNLYISLSKLVRVLKVSGIHPFRGDFMRDTLIIPLLSMLTAGGFYLTAAAPLLGKLLPPFPAALMSGVLITPVYAAAAHLAHKISLSNRKISSLLYIRQNKM